MVSWAQVLEWAEKQRALTDLRGRLPLDLDERLKADLKQEIEAAAADGDGEDMWFLAMTGGKTLALPLRDADGAFNHDALDHLCNWRPHGKPLNIGPSSDIVKWVHSLPAVGDTAYFQHSKHDPGVALVAVPKQEGWTWPPTP